MHHLAEHWGDVLTGAFGGVTLWTWLAFALNTAPTPESRWGQWVLGLAKFAVAQKFSAMNVLKGQETLITGVPRGMGTGSGNGVQSAGTGTTASQQSGVEVTPESIIITDKKESKTVIPNPGLPDGK